MNQGVITPSARGRQAILVGILLNVLLAGVKIAAGVLGSSQALIADGIESGLDVISSLMIWGALKYSERPPDSDHPYGHGKIESLAGVAGSMILVGAGGLVAFISMHSLWNLHTGVTTVSEVPAGFTLIVLVLVIATKELLFRFLSGRGNEISSSSMKTDAWHHRSDAITSLAAFLGISIAIIGGPAFASADRWAALFSCVIIVFNGIGMLRSSIGEVIDEQASAELIEQILTKACSVPGVSSAEKCRVRKSGLTRIADLHIRVDGEISVRQGHEIAHLVVHSLLKSDLNLSDVTVHIEPEPILEL